MTDCLDAPFHIADLSGCYVTHRPITDDEIIAFAGELLTDRLRHTDTLSSPQHAKALLMARLARREREVFACLFLDNKHRLIEYEELFLGTIDGASVYPREIVKRALHHNAAAVILSHNHPSGVAEMSRADETITEKIVDILKVVDVRVLDHIVIGDGTTVSFAERGILP